jgi:outer membrane protein assembly factor BamD (BamD/ComL family)
MIRTMTFRIFGSALISATALLWVSCGNSEDTVPLMAGNTRQAASQGEGLYLQAKGADEGGNARRAIKLYDQMATRYPFAPSAPQARFRQAELLESRGEVLKSFEAYQKFLTRFQGSGLYSQALSRQAAMAQAAADGEVRSGFMGLRSRISLDKTVEMLGKVRDNAPKSRTATKAQFTIGELYESRKKTKEAIAAYRQLVRDHPESPEAPEALFRVGQILTREADRGNRNQATLDLAREAFNDYLIQYPGHRRNAEARANVANLGGRELQRTFETAEYYRRTGELDSARIYYRDVVKRSGSGRLHDSARARLRELGE